MVKKTVTFIKKESGERVPTPCFIPAFQSQFEAVAKYKDGAHVQVKAKQIREKNYNDQYHAVMNFVFNNLPESYVFRSIEQFANWTKIKVGFTEEIGIAGEVFSVPRSASFAKADERDFMDNLYNPAFSLWETILGVERDQLIEGSLQFSADLRYKSLRGHGGDVMTIYCCGCEMDTQARLTLGIEIYPHRRDLHKLPFWKCDSCGNYVGCHYKTKERTRPLGVIATPEIMQARRNIHKILDSFYTGGGFSKKQVYAGLSKILGYEYHTAEIKSMAQARVVVTMLLILSRTLKPKRKT